MTLSIIIPYYNKEKYFPELLRKLTSQIVDGVEVIVVDDGSKSPLPPLDGVTVIRQDNRGVSAARNKGLENSKGDYVAFIDADDMIAADYVKNILQSIKKSSPDYIELSWKSLTPEGLQFNCKVSNTQRLNNPSVCTRIFKRSFIGSVKFNELKDAGEDEEFSRQLDFSKGKRDFIGSYMYFYRTTAKDSAVKRYKQGMTNTKRIVYHCPEITPDIVEEIKREDARNEIILFTNSDKTAELAKYCTISRPRKTWAHEQRGERCNLVEIINPPLITQVVIYVDLTTGHDGMTTFLYNFCQRLRTLYDITILYDTMSPTEINRLRPLVRTIPQGTYNIIQCDTLLLMRVWNEIPEGVQYKQLFQLVHCVNSPITPLQRDPKDCIFVSDTSRKSYTDKKARVIHNMSSGTDPEKILVLVSTSRIGARDKGNQDKRMLKLANVLNRQRIKFLWFYFSDNTLVGAPDNLIRVSPLADVRDFLKRADYLVQLSDNEAYCYSITEALSLGVPVIATNIPVLSELGVKHKKHGYIIPDDCEVDGAQFLKIPKFKPFEVDKPDDLIKAWADVLGNTTPTGDYIPEEKVITKVIQTYKDMELDRTLSPGEVVDMWRDRAEHLQSMDLVKIMEG